MDQKVQKLLNEALIPRLAHNRRRQVTELHRGLALLHAKECTLAMTGTLGRLISSTPEQAGRSILVRVSRVTRVRVSG